VPKQVAPVSIVCSFIEYNGAKTVLGDGDIDDYDFQVDGGQNRLDVQVIL
jgi:hypothetical protein